MDTGSALVVEVATTHSHMAEARAARMKSDSRYRPEWTDFMLPLWYFAEIETADGWAS